MSWSKIKTFMIMMLMIVNVYFMYNLYKQYQSRYYIDETMTKNTIELMREAGIEIGEGVIPEKIYYNRVYEGNFGEEYYRKVIEEISGTKNYTWHMMNNGTRSIVKGTGDVFEFYNSDIFGIKYIKEGEKSEKAEIYERYVSEGYELREERGVKVRRPVEILEEFLFSKRGNEGIEYGLRVKQVGYNEEDGVYVIECKEEIEGMEADGCEIKAVISGNSVMYIEGSLIYIESGTSYSTALYDQINILFIEKEYIEEGGKERDYRIEKVTGEYCINWNSERNKFFLIPAWRIEYEDGTVHIRNAVNGRIYII